MKKIEGRKRFVERLLSWNSTENNREMPWKGEKNPYKIWLSEIILQQTRVDQGVRYYNSFISSFPDIETLAVAEEEMVYKKWEGLGYYSRCRNLIKAARQIHHGSKGTFPSTYQELLNLPGVGSYTAAAISSFAYNENRAVLDGNVYRILSRVFLVRTPIDTSEGKKVFGQLAQELLPSGFAAEYNQAIMDFGATVCTPKPKCSICPMQQICVAFKNNQQNDLPVKQKQLIKTNRYLHYLLITDSRNILVRQRLQNDIWKDLYEFVAIETDEPKTKQEILNLDIVGSMKPFSILSFSSSSQKLTHQNISLNFLFLKVDTLKSYTGFHAISVDKAEQLAFPVMLKKQFDVFKQLLNGI